MRSSRRIFSFVVALASLTAGLSRPARAQDPTLETPAAPHGRSDHGRAVGHLGWAAFGNLASVQVGSIGTLAAPALTSTTVTTPAVGGRWWLTHGSTLDLGIDAGLGFVFGTANASSTISTPASTTTTTTSIPSNSGIFLHVGLPLAMFPTEHAVLNIIPEVDIGGAWANGNNQNNGGFVFDVGGRIGPEISLGFFGVPQFSIQPSVSLFLNVNTFGGSTSGTVAGATSKASSSQTNVAFFTGGFGLAFFYYPTLS